MNKKLKIIYESIIVLLAILSIVFIWIDNSTTQLLNKIVWLVFFVDVLVRFIIAKHKWQFIKKNPFDIIAALPLDGVFQSARIVRIFRLLRLFSIGKRYLKPLFGILKTNGLNKILTVALFVLVIGSILVKHFEPQIETYTDALWWSIVTTTTVGYGDLSPVTNTGRLIATLLMLLGIGLIGTLTSSITTYFVHDQPNHNATIKFIISELNRYEDLTIEEKKRLEMLLHELNKDESFYKNNHS